MLSRLRQVLSYRVSIAGLTEVAIWLGAVYLTIGLVWSFLHFDHVQRMQAQLEEQLHLPAGNELVALGEASVLWPVILVLPARGCAH